MLVRFASILVATAYATFVAGCSPNPYYTLDGGAPSDVPLDTLTLELVSAPSIMLGFGGRATVELILRDRSGAPAVGETVTFSLDGTPADASIDAIDDVTGADGHVSVGVIAGAAPASFRLRVAHARARLVFVDVAIGAAFGTLRVVPTYEGARELAQTVVHVFSDRDCAAALLDGTGGRERAVPEGASEVTLTLPVGLTYAVLAHGEASGGALYAAACADGITLDATTPTTVPLTLVDSAIGYDGSYEIMLALDATAALGGPDTGSIVADVLGGSAGDAARLVDALAGLLEADGSTLEAAALRADRASIEAALASGLDGSATAPSAVLGARMAEAETLVATLGFDGWLSIGLVGAPSITLDRILLGGPDTTVVLDGLGGGVPVLFARVDAESDSLRIEHLDLDLPLGALLLRVAEAGALGSGDGSLAAALDIGSCAILAARIASDTSLAAACDASCRRAACDAALAATTDALEEAIVVLDAERAHLALGGFLDASDSDGDGETDAWSGEIGGAWVSADGERSGTLGGACTASRPVP